MESTVPIPSWVYPIIVISLGPSLQLHQPFMPDDDVSGTDDPNLSTYGLRARIKTPIPRLKMDKDSHLVPSTNHGMTCGSSHGLMHGLTWLSMSSKVDTWPYHHLPPIMTCGTSTSSGHHSPFSSFGKGLW
jgi:hypothetical protein